MDGDGSVTIQDFAYSSGQTGRRLFVEFHQKTRNGGVIELIAQQLPGGTLDVRQGRRRGTTTFGTRYRFTGQRAVDVLCRLKPHLVTKRVRTNRILRELGFAERVGTDSVPVYPSRKWLAGYFDADGCISACVRRNRATTTATITLSIDTDGIEKDGIELVQKVFGGAIRGRGATGNCWRWNVNPDAAKVKAFFTPIAKHLVVKQEQAYFLLGCAETGHFRDGEIIRDTLQVMKTHPHRLSDLAAEVDVSGFLAKVRDLQPEPGRRYRSAGGQLCSFCGTRAPYAHGFCNPCWQKARYTSRRLKRQSEQLTLFA